MTAKSPPPGGSSETPNYMGLIDESIQRMQRTPGSGTAMCHKQGKTAVYVSACRRFIIEHPPHGPITLTPYRPEPKR